MGKRIRWSTLGMTAGALALVGLIGRGLAAGPPTTAREKDAANATRTVLPASGTDERGPVPAGGVVAGNGLVEPAGRETKVAAQGAGRIARIRVAEGDRVEEGAVLVELDDASERAALRAAAADLAQAEAELSRTAHGLRREDVDAATGEAGAAKARAALSAGTLVRTESLAKSGGATADELDRARRGAESDEMSSRAADARRRAALAGSRAEDVVVARARVLAMKARRDQAEATAERLVVRAPQAGEILQIKLRAGEYYAPGAGEPLLVMGETRRLRVRMDVEERDIGKVRVGERASVTADSFPGQRFAGKVAEIGRRMGRKNIRTDEPTERLDTKILEVVLDLDDAPKLVPGQRVVAYLEPGAG